MLSLIHTLLVILSLIITVVVMVQSKGTGLSVIPGSNDFGKFERRGAELSLHRATIGIITLFVVLSVVWYLFA